jgi:hypothetical protein
MPRFASSWGRRSRRAAGRRRPVHPALLEQLGRHLGDHFGQCSLGLGHLLRESRDALPEPAQHAAHGTWTRPQPSSRLGESLPGQPSQALAHLIGGADEDRAQLVECGGARLHGAATLEQEQAQILAPTTPAGQAQALASAAERTLARQRRLS